MISSRRDRRELEVVNEFYDQSSKKGDSIEKIVYRIKFGLDEDLVSFITHTTIGV